MKQRLLSVILISLIVGYVCPNQVSAFSLPNFSLDQASEDSSALSVPDILKDLPKQRVDDPQAMALDATSSASIDTSFLIEEVDIQQSTESASKPSVLPISPDNVKGISTYFTAFHPAVDIRAEVGSPILAIRDGVVVEAQYQAGGYGRYIVIEHLIGDRSVRSLYAHMKSATVHVGDRVTAKMIIGYVGMTGHTTGPHLHMEVRACNPDAAFYLCPAIDPVRFLAKGLPGVFVAKK